jgi:hypothetical protein
MNEATNYLQTLWNLQAPTGRVTIPPGEYGVDAALDFRGAVRQVDARGAVLNWLPSTPGTILKIGQADSAKLSRLRWDGGEVCGRYSASGPAAGSKGIEITNVNMSHISLDAVRYCETGVVLRAVASSTSMCYNVFRFGDLGAKAAIRCELQNGSWINANIFRETLFTPVGPGNVLIDVPLSCDTWRFRDCWFEGPPAIIRVGRGFEFHGCRWETNDADRFTIQHPKNYKPEFAGAANAARWVVCQEI